MQNYLIMKRRKKNSDDDVNGIGQDKVNVASGRGCSGVSQVVSRRIPRRTRNDSSSDRSHTENTTQPGLSEATTESNKMNINRQKWTKEQYKDVMWSYYYAKENNIEGGVVQGTYTIWRNRNPGIFPNINKDTLANQRRFIINNRKLTDIELEEILTNIREANIQNNEHHNLQVEEEIPTAETYQLNIEEQTEEILQEQNTDAEIVEMEQKIKDKVEEIKQMSMYDRNRIRKIWLSSKVREKISIANKALGKIMNNSNPELTEINQLMYAAAIIIAGEVPQNNQNTINQEPKWQVRIKNHIDNCRRELSLLSEFRKGVTTRKVLVKVDDIFRRSKVSKDHIEELVVSIQMKLQAKAQRLRRYIKRREQYHQNKLFNENTKKFYRTINQSNKRLTNPPLQGQLEDFWRGTLENKVEHNRQATWIKTEYKSCEKIEQGTWNLITEEEVVDAIKKNAKLEVSWIGQTSELLVQKFHNGASTTNQILK